MLTGDDNPDSSRFWSAAKYEVGRGQESFDKQYLRGRPIQINFRQVANRRDRLAGGTRAEGR